MFHTKFVQEIKTHFMFNFLPPPQKKKSCRLSDDVEKYGTAVQPTDESIAHAHSMLDT
jgi:hypothetical protein